MKKFNVNQPQIIYFFIFPVSTCLTLFYLTTHHEENVEIIGTMIKHDIHPRLIDLISSDIKEKYFNYLPLHKNVTITHFCSS